MPRITVGRFSQDAMLEIYNQISASSDRIFSVLEKMRAANVEELEIKGHAEINRSLRYLFKFSQNAEMALHELQISRGDMGIEIPDAFSQSLPVSDVSARKRPTRKKRKKSS